jgi:hypothetical protein
MYIVGKCRILFVKALGTGGKANVKNKLLWLILQRAHYPDPEPTSLCSYSLMLCVIITHYLGIFCLSYNVKKSKETAIFD